jgi:hypothetical protein
MFRVHPVSYLSRITADGLAADFNRVSGYARILQQVRLLPVTNGRALERVGPDRIVPLMASVAFADSLFDAAAVGTAFDTMTLVAGAFYLPRLQIFSGIEDPVTLPMLFGHLVQEAHRHEVEVDLVRYRAPGRDRQFAATIYISGQCIEFGAERPSYCARATIDRLSHDAFKALRDMFRHGEAEYARLAAERVAAQ